MFLEQTGVPAPKVYDFALEGPSNAVGVGFILMEKLPGKSLRWSVATQQQREKVMRQVAELLSSFISIPLTLLALLIAQGNLMSAHLLENHLPTLCNLKCDILGLSLLWKSITYPHSD